MNPLYPMYNRLTGMKAKWREGSSISELALRVLDDITLNTATANVLVMVRIPQIPFPDAFHRRGDEGEDDGGNEERLGDEARGPGDRLGTTRSRREIADGWTEKLT